MEIIRQRREALLEKERLQDEERQRKANASTSKEPKKSLAEQLSQTFNSSASELITKFESIVDDKLVNLEDRVNAATAEKVTIAITGFSITLEELLVKWKDGLELAVVKGTDGVLTKSLEIFKEQQSKEQSAALAKSQQHFKEQQAKQQSAALDRILNVVSEATSTINADTSRERKRHEEKMDAIHAQLVELEKSQVTFKLGDIADTIEKAMNPINTSKEQSAALDRILNVVSEATSTINADISRERKRNEEKMDTIHAQLVELEKSQVTFKLGDIADKIETAMNPINTRIGAPAAGTNIASTIQDIKLDTATIARISANVEETVGRIENSVSSLRQLIGTPVAAGSISSLLSNLDSNQAQLDSRVNAIDEKINAFVEVDKLVSILSNTGAEVASIVQTIGTPVSGHSICSIVNAIASTTTDISTLQTQVKTTVENIETRLGVPESGTVVSCLGAIRDDTSSNLLLSNETRKIAGSVELRIGAPKEGMTITSSLAAISDKADEIKKTIVKSESSLESLEHKIIELGQDQSLMLRVDSVKQDTLKLSAAAAQAKADIHSISTRIGAPLLHHNIADDIAALCSKSDIIVSNTTLLEEKIGEPVGKTIAADLEKACSKFDECRAATQTVQDKIGELPAGRSISGDISAVQLSSTNIITAVGELTTECSLLRKSIGRPAQQNRLEDIARGVKTAKDAADELKGAVWLLEKRLGTPEQGHTISKGVSAALSATDAIIQAQTRIQSEITLLADHVAVPTSNETLGSIVVALRHQTSPLPQIGADLGTLVQKLGNPAKGHTLTLDITSLQTSAAMIMKSQAKASADNNAMDRKVSYLLNKFGTFAEDESLLSIIRDKHQRLIECLEGVSQYVNSVYELITNNSDDDQDNITSMSSIKSDMKIIKEFLNDRFSAISGQIDKDSGHIFERYGRLESVVSQVEKGIYAKIDTCHRPIDICEAIIPQVKGLLSDLYYNLVDAMDGALNDENSEIHRSDDVRSDARRYSAEPSQHGQPEGDGIPPTPNLAVASEQNLKRPRSSHTDSGHTQKRPKDINPGTAEVEVGEGSAERSAEEPRVIVINREREVEETEEEAEAEEQVLAEPTSRWKSMYIGKGAFNPKDSRSNDFKQCLLPSVTKNCIIQVDIALKRNRENNAKINPDGEPLVCWLAQFRMDEGWREVMGVPKLKISFASFKEQQDWWSEKWVDKTDKCPFCKWAEAKGDIPSTCFFYLDSKTIKYIL